VVLSFLPSPLPMNCLGLGRWKVSKSKRAALSRLLSLREGLVESKGQLETRSEHGQQAAREFLQQLEEVAIIFEVAQAPRDRWLFSVNYRALFPRGARCYCRGVLDAVPPLYAIGNTYEFSAETVSRSVDLHHALRDLKVRLTGESSSFRNMSCALRESLEEFDVAWALFEECYIRDLITIEKHGLDPLVSVIRDHQLLLAIEHELDEPASQRQEEPLEKHQEMREETRRRLLQEHRDALHQMVNHLSQLSAAVNACGNRHGEFNFEVLEAALQTVADAEHTETRSASRILAEGVLAAFCSVRRFMQEVYFCLDTVDPTLCNNPGLVDLLDNLRKSWETGSRFLVDVRVRNAVDSLVDHLRVVRVSSPAFASMCESCDPEFFLVLPRLLMLTFLAAPEKHLELMRLLMPQRFPVIDASAKADRALEKLRKSFNRTQRILEKSGDAWETLVGVSMAEDKLGCSQLAGSQLKEFALELEKWSMELQRHCPQDWNQFSAIITHCIQE